jgi:hypothetical protein
MYTIMVVQTTGTKSTSDYFKTIVLSDFRTKSMHSMHVAGKGPGSK